MIAILEIVLTQDVKPMPTMGNEICEKNSSAITKEDGHQCSDKTKDSVIGLRRFLLEQTAKGNDR